MLDTDGEPQAQLRVLLERPIECGADVVPLREDQVVALRSLGLHRQPGRLGELQEELCVPALGARSLAGLAEAFPGVLADRLEHRIAPAVEPDQALVHERLQRVQVGPCDLLCGRKRPTSGEDGELREQLAAP